MSRVSVIVPTYRRPHFLVNALASLKSQSMTDFEVLVCDNGAEAATEDVVRSLDDERFRYIPRPQNVGMLRNALLGFADARSPLVMKLDDDDALMPDALERLTRPFDQEPEIRLSFGGVQLVDENDAPLQERTQWLDRTSGRAFFQEGRLTGATGIVARGGVQLAGAVVRADLVDWASVPAEVGTAYDFHLALTAAENDRPLWFTKAPVVRYRLHPDADTNTHSAAQARATVFVLEQALGSGRHQDTSALQRRLGQATLAAGRALLHDGDFRSARPFLHRSFRLQPGLTAARLAVTSHLPSALLRRLVSARQSNLPAA
ncbi:glycosyltransferase family 2 protein [Ornithinimicrobium pratense]|uniref:Glycosyltransferase family 2 protein n=1 Tax=Ornithinimicrobium pratense TaxID=2593973 RepID=A0A5J6V6W9_9MICO|nr:glycosyltransferase family 2 protein [Ornithinimicrobium pratense]QFG69770.1 glycosyltransferase family 2 protein [Ornithinimicrobium pratense]